MEFEYKGKLISGKRVKGRLIADSREEALAELESRGVVPLSVDEATAMSRDISFKGRLKNSEFIMFLRQYATLINAGVSIAESTKTMAEQSLNKRLKDSLTDISKQVDRGESLSTAASRHNQVFPDLLVNMMYAGEMSGSLDGMLDDMADYYEKDHSNRRKMTSSLIYPVVVGVVAMLLVAFLLMFIVPRFTAMFSSFGEELPGITQLVITMSELMQSYWWVLIVLLVLMILGYRQMMKDPDIAYRIDMIKLKIPILGKLFQVSALARMTKTLGVLVSGSMPILQSIEITERVIENRVIKGILNEVRHVLEGGGEMSSVLERHDVIPNMLVQMVRVGERTGNLDGMLLKVSDFYEEDLEQLTTRFGTLIEPILIVFLTVVVGFIMMAIIVPMFTLYDSIS